MAILKNNPNIEFMGTSQSVSQAFAAIPILSPDIVLVDLVTRHSLEFVQKLVRIAPNTRVVALAVRDEESEIIACAEAGLAGYVTRESSLEELIKALKLAFSGELYCSPKMAASLFRRLADRASQASDLRPLNCLTKRESRILELVDQGLSNKQIARELHIEVTTVKNHVHNILEKLKVRNRGEAAALVRRLRHSDTRALNEIDLELYN